jgi:thiamine-monophosphate kinase
MIDTSDGLLRDAARIAAASGVRVDLDGGQLAPGPELKAAADALGDPALAAVWVLTGGEDHAMLACFPPGASVPPAFRPIGVVRVGNGVVVDGAPWRGADGWHHFRE